MDLSNLKPAEGSRQSDNFRRGRGHGSGNGKTAGKAVSYTHLDVYKRQFLVHPEANKTMIKEAVEKMFEGAKVKTVNTMNLDGKTKRREMCIRDSYKGAALGRSQGVLLV